MRFLWVELDSRAVAYSAMAPPISRPVLIVLTVSPCQVPGAGEALEAFEERCPFLVQFARWLSPAGHDCGCECHLSAVSEAAGDVECISLVDAERHIPGTIAVTMTAILPESALPDLADLCQGRGLVLVRGASHAYQPSSRTNIKFDWLATVRPWEAQLEGLPTVEDVYTIEEERYSRAPTDLAFSLAERAEYGITRAAEEDRAQ